MNNTLYGPKAQSLLNQLISISPINALSNLDTTADSPAYSHLDLSSLELRTETIVVALSKSDSININFLGISRLKSLECHLPYNPIILTQGERFLSDNQGRLRTIIRSSRLQELLQFILGSEAQHYPLESLGYFSQLTTPGSGHARIIHFTGFSGMGKSYLLYEAACVLACMKNVRLTYVNQLRYIDAKMEETQLLIDLLAGTFYDWDGIEIDGKHYVWNELASFPIDKILPSVSEKCQEKGILWIFICDQINTAFSRPLKFFTKDFLVKVSGCTFTTVLSFSANNMNYEEYLPKSHLFVKLLRGFEPDEIDGFLEFIIPDQFREQLIEYTNGVPYYLESFRHYYHRFINLGNSTENAIENALTDFLLKLVAIIKASFDKLVEENPNDDIERQIINGIKMYYFKLSKKGPKDLVVFNRKFMDSDFGPVHHISQLAGDLIIARYYSRIIEDLFYVTVYFRSSDADNATLGRFLETLIIQYIKKTMTFPVLFGETKIGHAAPFKDANDCMKVENQLVFLNPLSRYFPFVDFIFAKLSHDPAVKSFLIFVQLTTSMASKSIKSKNSEDGNTVNSGPFLELKKSLFYHALCDNFPHAAPRFIYIGDRKLIPKAEADDELIEFISLDFLLKSTFPIEHAGSRWKIFLDNNPGARYIEDKRSLSPETPEEAAPLIKKPRT